MSLCSLSWIWMLSVQIDSQDWKLSPIFTTKYTATFQTVTNYSPSVILFGWVTEIAFLYIKSQAYIRLSWLNVPDNIYKAASQVSIVYTDIWNTIITIYFLIAMFNILAYLKNSLENIFFCAFWEGQILNPLPTCFHW